MLHVVALLLCYSLPTAEDSLPKTSPLPPPEEQPIGDEPAPPAAQDEVPPAPPDETWNGAVTVGATWSDGNTDVKRISANLDAVKSVEKNRWTLGFSYNRSEEDGEVTQDRTYAKGQYDYFMNEKNYLLAQATAEEDDGADLDLRYTAGVGYGHQFSNTERWKFATEAGVSYFHEEFESGDENGYVAARLAWNADWKYSDRWQFTQSGQVFPSLEDSEDVYAQVDTRIKATLSESMFAQLQWVYSWDNTPAPDTERVDNLYVLTVGWSF